MAEKKNNWVVKSDKNSHHDNTSLKENIVQMFFKIKKEDFWRRKPFVF